MSWLSTLAQHSMFALPLDDETTSSTRALSTLSGPDPAATPSSLARAATSGQGRLESIFPSARAKSTPVRQPRSTPTRTPTAASARTHHVDPQTHVQQAEKLAPIGCARNDRMCLIRGGTELILAVGRELRISNLKHAKASSNSASASRAGQDEPDLGEYKVLTPRGGEIPFDISRLVVNQTNQLLAVIGHHSLRVVQLPRPGQTWSNPASVEVPVTVYEVGKFYHSLTGSSPVVDALWHPLGQHSSSLVVLTEDCTLREYTLHESSEEPSQTLSFSRNGESNDEKQKKKKKRMFSAEDERAHEATAMVLGDCHDASSRVADWGKMTVYALMKNGDVKSICPFLPKRSSIPRQYLEGLHSFVSTKLDSLSSTDSTLAASPSPSSSHPPSSLSRSTDHPDSSPSRVRRDVVEKRYLVQLQYLQTLLRQFPAADADARDDDGTSDEPDDVGAVVVDVVAPVSRPNFKPAVQGPYLFSPSTVELAQAGTDRRDDDEDHDDDDDDEATIATDLCYLAARIGVLMVVYRNGKLEVCLEVDKPEARFGIEDSQLAGAVVLRRGGGARGVEEDGERDGGDLPMLWVHETLDLGWSTEKRAGRGRGGGWPTLTRDELYGDDTVWIGSKLGVQCFVLDTTAFELGTMDDGGESQVYWAIKTSSPDMDTVKDNDDDEEHPSIVGLQVINDVYLGYSLLAVTPRLQLVGIELSLRVDDAAAASSPSADPSPASPRPVTNPGSAAAVGDDSPRGYTSLLETPFDLPAILANPTLRARPRLPGPPATSSSDKVEITPQSLRQFGQVVEAYQTLIRQVAQGADAVQHRLELQFRELSRQLEKLENLRATTGDLRTSTLGGGEAALGGGGGGGLVARMGRIERTQVELLTRLDSVLQRLIERHQGRDELSQFERKWFKELERLERQVKGDKAGLEVKAQRVEAMWQELREPVERIVERKQESQGTPARGGSTLGRTQIQGLESKLSEEAKMLSDAKKKVDRLTRSLAAASI